MTGVVLRVVVDTAPVWTQYAVAAGTIGAAVFAGWAAWMARRSVAAATALIDLERDRDTLALTEAHVKHARRVSVEATATQQPVGNAVLDVMITLTNAGTDPIFKCRLKLGAGGVAWGPQLVGMVAPGASVVAIARLHTSQLTDLNGWARFVDVRGTAWIADARGRLAEDDQSLQTWIDEQAEFWQAFEARSGSAAERGTIIGAANDAVAQLRDWSEQANRAAGASPP